MNRRNFLKMVGVGSGAALVGSPVIQALASEELPPVLMSPADANTRDPISHILNRITFGPRPGQVDAVKKMGIQAYLEQQLNPESINDDDSEKRLGDYITLDLSGPELYALGKDHGEAATELDSATVMRAMYSHRELYEVMVGFWSEHFSIYHGKGECRTLKTLDDREVVRKYALGKFRDLLGASAHSPAMMVYLDNAQSNKSHPNENYAREIMELHTITIGNYTETDVKELARAFTGWSIQGPKDPTPGEFMFRKNIHDDSAKTVMGHTLPAGGGLKDVETMLDVLASHPGTARHIASKLVRRFVADDPPQNVVDAAAQTFLSSGGDIKSVLRVIFASPEFAGAPPKYKRPFEYLVSLFRSFDMQVKGNLGLDILALFKSQGQLPFDHITPDGYTDNASWWMGNLLLRWNSTIHTIYSDYKNTKVDLFDQASKYGNATTARAVLDYFAQHLFGRVLSQVELDSIWSFTTRKGEPKLDTPDGKKILTDAIAILAGSPAYQYR